MINFDKFLASFITEMKKYQPITCYNLPACIKKALEDQGLEYKDGEIVKTQDIITVESEDEKIRKRIIQAIKIREKEMNEEWSDEIAWLEKQGNPNKEYWKGYKDGKKVILDKYSETHKVVESKFKVGDWVVDEDDNCVYQIERAIENVTSGEFSYDLVGGGYFPSTKKNYHLWTIQDAKPGDVLADDYGIYIFDRFDEHDKRCFLCMGAYQYSQKVFENKHMLCSVEVHPVTKEQRDLLFQKMHEAGYMWDSKSKQLLSLKAEPSDIQIPTGWSHEDDVMVHDILGLLPVKTRPEYNQRREDWLKSIKDRVQPKPTEWSEEDEGFFNLLYSIFRNEHPNGVFSTGNITVFNGNCVTSNRIITWFKSIKDKVQSKSIGWSEEDESMYTRTLGILDKCYMRELPTKVVEELNWFKSIRTRIKGG